MENTSINATQNTVTEVTESNENMHTPEIHLDGLEQYKDIIGKLKEKLLPIVQEGYMSEIVANRIVDEFSFDAFKQSVKVNYR